MKEDIRKLPVLIDHIGNYITRDGKMVEIHDVKPPKGGEGVTEFLAKGSMRIPKTSGGYKYRYNIWHVSGRQFTFAESPHDVVGKL